MEGDEMAAGEDAVVSEADGPDEGVTPPGSGGKGAGRFTGESRKLLEAYDEEQATVE
jgi:hypothetical protein